MEPTPKKKLPWFAIIIVIIVILAVVQWSTTKSKQAAETGSNAYSTSTLSGQINDPAQVGPISTSTSTSSTNSKNFMHTITLETSKGTIVFETYDTDAPKTVENFITLSNKGFYKSVIFHRVISGFMIQGGDPTGTGMGGPGYKFADELNPNTESAKRGYVRGTVAMANAGPNTNGSQFFIMHQDNPLPHSYTIFGRVVKGIEVVDAIASVTTNGNDRPLEDVVIKGVTIAEKK
jgi:cyclophilin family peptidyl-prolyl cis-trans isomerase